MKTYFNDFIKSQKAGVPFLPCFHTCDAYTFRDILGGGKLMPTLSDQFVGEELLFFFYGKPSYRTYTSDDDTTLTCFLPICLIIDQSSLIDIKRIAPFDTGAFKDNLYKTHIHKKMAVDDFVMESQMDNIAKLITFFYESNDNYLAGNVKNDRKKLIPESNYEVHAYFSLISEKSKSSADNRKRTIEIQLDKFFNLSSSNVKGIIIPETLFDDKAFQEKLVLTLDKTTIIPYPVSDISPKEYHGIIIECANKFINTVI